MFSACVVPFQFSCRFLRTQFNDVPEDRMDEVLADGLKAPRWILGHLAEGHMFAATFLNVPHEMPPTWVQAFAPGTSPTHPYGAENAEDLPTKDELLAWMSEIEPRLIEAAQAVPEGSLSEPHGIEFLYGTGIETQSDLVAHLLTTHMGIHLGQLTIWRRTAGVEPII